jgi:hypothetical protein
MLTGYVEGVGELQARQQQGAAPRRRDPVVGGHLSLRSLARTRAQYTVARGRNAVLGDGGHGGR